MTHSAFGFQRGQGSLEALVGLCFHVQSGILPETRHDGR